MTLLVGFLKQAGRLQVNTSVDGGSLLTTVYEAQTCAAGVCFWHHTVNVTAYII